MSENRKYGDLSHGQIRVNASYNGDLGTFPFRSEVAGEKKLLPIKITAETTKIEDMNKVKPLISDIVKKYSSMEGIDPKAINVDFNLGFSLKA
ncbi:hypothetical protein [Bacillus pumilus]|uniref:hypothetical protein n=1 Tax=Bacillus pumilus TaxID=1408 RepID=UPI000D031CB8|nr:hypothetical protein [Bacillus pumilus]PRS57951.1 hypothetical protein C6X97_18360 [Bacillus pumilus]